MIRLGSGRIPISLTIVTTFVGLVTVMLGSVLAVGYFASLCNTEGLIAELAIQSNGIVTEELHDYLGPVTEQAIWVANLISEDSFDRADEDQVRRVLSAALAATPQVTVLAYISAEEVAIEAYRGELGDDGRLDIGPSEDPGFAGLMLQTSHDRENGFWNEILFGELSQRSYINYLQPVRRDGEFLGVVLAAVSLNELSEIVTEISDRQRGTVFILADRDQVIAHPNLTSDHPDLSKETPTVGIGHVGDPILEEFWSAKIHPIAVSEELGDLVLRRTTVAGQHYVFAHVPIKGYGEGIWIVGQHLDAETAEAALQALRDSLIVSLVILVVAIGLSIFFGRKIARPIQAASAGAARIAELEISEVKELPRSPFTELDAQAQSFNAMLVKSMCRARSYAA